MFIKKGLLLLAPLTLFFNAARAQNINPAAIGINISRTATTANSNLPVNSHAVLVARVANVGWANMMTNSFMVQVAIDTTKFMWDPAGVYDSTTNNGLWSITTFKPYAIWLKNTHGPILPTATPGGFYYYDLVLKVKVKQTASAGPAYANVTVSVPSAMSAAYGIWDVDNTSNSNYRWAAGVVTAPVPITLSSSTPSQSGFNTILNRITNMKQNSNENIAIYPNPVSDQLIVDDLKGGAQVVVYSGSGQKVADITATGNQIIVPFKHMAAGSYNVVINKDGQRLKSKLIVKK